MHRKKWKHAYVDDFEDPILQPKTSLRRRAPVLEEEEDIGPTSVRGIESKYTEKLQPSKKKRRGHRERIRSKRTVSSDAPEFF